MKFIYRIVTTESPIDKICQQFQPDRWGADNKMTSYQPKLLREFLANDKNILLFAYADSKIAGAALVYFLPHPASEDTLYVHELDVHPNFRRQGVAEGLMNEVFQISRERGCPEVWLEASSGNVPANTLYKKLAPNLIKDSVLYSWDIDLGKGEK